MQTERGPFDSPIRNYQSWLMGFVTGINVERSDYDRKQIDNVDMAAIDLWMRNWCNSHLTKTVFEGARAFRKELQN